MDYAAPNFEYEFKKSDSTGRTFTGYASTFDIDLGGDLILPGAFSKTLQERSSRVKILWEHKKPIGKPRVMSEDSKGLYVEGYISETQLGNDALTLMRDNVVDQMSIGYSVPQGKSQRDDSGLRIIQEVKLFEFSPVTFPMNENAFIESIKSAKGLIKSNTMSANELKELSELLTDIKTLLTTEPPRRTQPEPQPSELKQLLEAVNNFGL